MYSLHSQSDLLLAPLHLIAHTGLIKKADFFVLPYISFIIAFTALEWIRYMESLYSQSGLTPLFTLYRL